MKKIDDIELLRLNKLQRFFYKLKCFFVAIPFAIWNFIKSIGKFFKKLGINIYIFFRDLVRTFIRGDYRTKVSYLIMGFGSFARGQIGRGILFALTEVVFIIYMITTGGYYLRKFNSLGTVQEYSDDHILIGNSDNSFKILLYGILTIFFLVAFIYTWYLNVKQNKLNDELELQDKKLASTKDDLRSLVDQGFYKTVLSLPVLGIVFFTIMPIIFMILVAFTNYSGSADGQTTGLFGWVGLESFNQVLNWSNSSGTSYSATFGEILTWTLIWAFFATFTNYFLGMMVAILINKKGIKYKKLWRTILVISIAVPQFISLLYVKTLFAYDGPLNNLIVKLGGQAVHFLDNDANKWVARFTVIGVNIWIGIPYLMLVVTGILMNIPADLYESANIDGANVWQQYTKITLPYMLFVTGPYLLTSFTGNMNNFNVIYLLTGGAPQPLEMVSSKAGQTDLLITWLFNLAISGSDYYLGAVIGILVFIVVAFISLVVYNIIPSVKNEEDFQ